MNNAVYGKTMESLNRIDVKLVSNKKNYFKCQSLSKKLGTIF